MSKLSSGQLTLLIFFAIVAVVIIVCCIAESVKDVITGRYEDSPQPEPGEDKDVDG